MLTIHEFGKENKDILVLIHPAVVMWDYFEYMIPLMENKYHLVILALPGYDESRPRDLPVWRISRRILKNGWKSTAIPR